MQTPSLILYACAAVGCIVPAATGWLRHRRTPAAAALTLIAGSAASWCLSAMLRMSDQDGLHLVGNLLTIPAAYGSAIGTWLLVHLVIDPGWRPRRALATLLITVPALTLLAVAAQQGRSMTDSAGPGQGLLGVGLESGPLAWFFACSIAALALSTYGKLLRSWPGSPWYLRRQLAVLLCAALLPSLAAIAGTAWPGWLPFGTNPVPLGFVCTGLIHTWALFRPALLSTLPIAREQVLDQIGYAVLVVDPPGRIVDENAAARRLRTLARPDLPTNVTGRLVDGVLPAAVLARLRDAGPSRTTVDLGGNRFVEVQVSALTDQRARVLGRLIVLHDVTDIVNQRTVVEKARERAEEANAQLHEQLRINEALRARLAEDAVRDALTGVHNRRQLDPSLAAAMAVAARDGEDFSLVLVDIDHFKSVNDTHGHAAGDEVLRQVAQTLLANSRPGDSVIRYGGEEFVVILPGVRADVALLRAEELRARCAGLAVAMPSSPTGSLHVTASFGVSTFPTDAGSAAGLLAAADAALYTAKGSGRDRVVAAGASAVRA